MNQNFFAQYFCAALCSIFFVQSSHALQEQTLTINADTLVNLAPHHKNIIFDLGDVIFYPSKTTFLSNLSLSDLLFYFLWDWQNPLNIQSRAFEFLDSINKKRSEQALHHGQVLPEIFCQYLKGTKTHKEIELEIEVALDKAHREGFFYSQTEKSLVQSICKTMFDPHFMANHVLTPMNKTVDVIKYLHNQKNDHGEKKHKLFILSNLGDVEFDILETKYPDIFALFDGIVISGKVHMMKPNKNIFEYLLTTYQLNPQECLYLDDLEQNVATALTCNMKSFIFE